jgi:NADH:ubiquinone oxidoreductase subunit 5 (subunit L)/multisubunit Na+/H+ antiporter MnhA subunit
MIDLYPTLSFALTTPLVTAALCLLLGHRLRSRTAYLALLGALLSLGALLQVGQASQWGQTVLLASRPWVPVVGLDIAFRVDGLSLFFALVVSGMGCAVLWYSASYMDEHAHDHGRFYAFLLLFMAAMLGTVLADDLLLLFIFWELTGISSFLLIGFHAGFNKESAYGARRALLVTLATGLGLLAGVLILRVDLGTTRLSEILAHPEALALLPNAGLILVCFPAGVLPW